VEGGEVSLELVRRVWERTAKILFSVVDYDACVDRRDRISPLRVLALWGFIWVVVVPEEEEEIRTRSLLRDYKVGGLYIYGQNWEGGMRAFMGKEGWWW
jgi:hypothetical protein